MKLLKNSIEIKTGKAIGTKEKLKEVILIQIKVLNKYPEFITILLSEIWGTENRNKIFRGYVFEYIKVIEEIVKLGMEKGEIEKGDAEVLASRNIWINMLKLNL